MPTIESVKLKEKEIKKALNYSFTSDDVSKIVKQKEKFQRNPVNYAMYKARLIKVCSPSLFSYQYVIILLSYC